MNNYMKVILSAVKTYIDKMAAKFNNKVNEIDEKIPTKVSQLENDKVFVTEEYVDNAITNASVQSDWNQNDETAKDYIKNRPFYEETAYTEVFAEQEVEFSSGRASLGNIWTDEKIYMVTIDGMSQTGQAYYQGRPVYSYLFKFDGGWEVDVNGFYAKDIVDGIHIVKVQQVETTIILIDEKYLPESVAKTSDVQTIINNKLETELGTESLLTASSTVKGAVNEVVNSLGNYYLKTEADTLHTEIEDYVDNQVAALVNAAPETLDTLGELATAFEENHDMVETLNEAIAFKANQSDLDKFKTETWTFTLNDGTTVTKQMVVK